MGKETRQQAPQYKLHYMCLPWCYRTMITSYQLPWCYRTMVSSYLLLLKTLFSPTLLLLSYHAITIAPKIYCKWTSLSDRTYRTNLGVYKSNLCLCCFIIPIFYAALVMIYLPKSRHVNTLDW